MPILRLKDNIPTEYKLQAHTGFS